MKKIGMMMVIAMAIVACATDAQAGWRRNSNTCANGSCAAPISNPVPVSNPTPTLIQTPTCSNVATTTTSYTTTTCSANRRRTRSCR